MSLVLTAPTAASSPDPTCLSRRRSSGRSAGALGGVFHVFGGLVLGGLSWTVGVAGKFILNTLGGLIRLLIPASWAKDGLQVMHWIVAVPDYAGHDHDPQRPRHVRVRGDQRAPRPVHVGRRRAAAADARVRDLTRRARRRAARRRSRRTRPRAGGGARVLPVVVVAGSRRGQPDHAIRARPAAGQPRHLQAHAVRGRRRRARRLAADRPVPDGRDRICAARR